MSFPARIYPEQIELALVHSRDNVNDKSQTIVDLMGGNRVKNLDMAGMGSNAVKDLGLLSVVASKDCFMLAGGKSLHNNNRNLAQNIASPVGGALAPDIGSAAALGDVRLDLNLLRAVGSDIVSMPALMTEIQVMMSNPLAYPPEITDKINTLLLDVANLNNLMQLGVLPEARLSIESLAKELSLRIADTSMALFDTNKISKDMLEFVTGVVDKARTEFNITSDDINFKMIAMEGRLNNENYLITTIEDLKQNLALALQNPDITDLQRAEITKTLETLSAVIAGEKNSLNITAVLASLSPSIIELLPENKQAAFANSITATIDAVYVTAASQLGISIDQMRTIDTAMLTMATTAQDLSQKLELLSPAEREILTQLQASVTMYHQSPLSLATIGEISKLQTTLADQMSGQNSGQNNVVNLDNFKNISPEMISALLQSVDTVLPAVTNILAEKWNMSPQEVYSIATTLMAAKDAYELELKTTTNAADSDAIQKILNDIAQVQLNPFSPQSAAIIATLMQSPIMERMATAELPSSIQNLISLHGDAPPTTPTAHDIFARFESILSSPDRIEPITTGQPVDFRADPTHPHTNFVDNVIPFGLPIAVAVAAAGDPTTSPIIIPTAGTPANDVVAPHSAPVLTVAPQPAGNEIPETPTVKDRVIVEHKIEQKANIAPEVLPVAPVTPVAPTAPEKIDDKPVPAEQKTAPQENPTPSPLPTEDKIPSKDTQPKPDESPKPQAPTEGKDAPSNAEPKTQKDVPDLKDPFNEKCKDCNKACAECAATFNVVAKPPKWEEFILEYASETGHANFERMAINETGTPLLIVQMIGNQLIEQHGAEHMKQLIKSGDYVEIIRSEHKKQLEQMKEALTPAQINEFKESPFQGDDEALVKYTNTLKQVEQITIKAREENLIIDSTVYKNKMEEKLNQIANENDKDTSKPKDEFNDKGGICPKGYTGSEPSTPNKPNEPQEVTKDTSKLVRDRSSTARPRRSLG